jgi:hypothetical protein
LEFIREIYTNFHAKVNLVPSPILLGLHVSVAIFCMQKEFDVEGQRMITVFWDLTLYTLVGKWHVSEKPTASILHSEEEAAAFFKTSVTT